MVSELRDVSFWFLRHGETDWNAQNLSQGNVEVPLNERGREQAREAAGKLRRRGIRTVISSPLGRAEETARIIAETLELNVAIDAGLREASYGEHEGEPMTGWYDDWVAGNHIPRGGESFSALRQRAVEAVNRALTRPGPVLVVAHGGFFRAVRGAMGLPIAVRTPNAMPFFCRPAAPAWVLTPLT
jgi:probable phosphoglycerate mutase